MLQIIFIKKSLRTKVQMSSKIRKWRQTWHWKWLTLDLVLEVACILVLQLSIGMDEGLPLSGSKTGMTQSSLIITIMYCHVNSVGYSEWTLLFFSVHIDGWHVLSVELSDKRKMYVLLYSFLIYSAGHCDKKIAGCPQNFFCNGFHNVNNLLNSH